MNKITGTIIESGSRTIVADGGQIQNVVVKTTWEQLKAWHGAIYGCEVIIESTERHDAREEGIAQLCEQIGQLRIDLAAREAEVEKFREELRYLQARDKTRDENMQFEIDEWAAKAGREPTK